MTLLVQLKGSLWFKVSWRLDGWRLPVRVLIRWRHQFNIRNVLRMSTDHNENVYKQVISPGNDKLYWRVVKS